MRAILWLESRFLNDFRCLSLLKCSADCNIFDYSQFVQIGLMDFESKQISAVYLSRKVVGKFMTPASPFTEPVLRRLSYQFAI